MRAISERVVEARAYSWRPKYGDAALLVGRIAGDRIGCADVCLLTTSFCRNEAVLADDSSPHQYAARRRRRIAMLSLRRLFEEVLK